MNNNKNTNAITFQPKKTRYIGNFEFIMSQVYECCALMLADFATDKIPNDEVEIHTRLYNDYLENNEILSKLGLKNYFFDFEVSLINPIGYTTPSRTDIKVYHNKDRETDRKAYNIVELKRIDGKTRLNKYYITGGIQRFTSLQYPAFFGVFGMIAFVVKSININNNVTKINNLLNKNYKADINTQKLLTQSHLSNSWYESAHKDTSGKDLKGYHQFWDISAIII